MLNGIPFLTSMALTRIQAMADNLEISQKEAEELTAIARKNGMDILPSDAMGRLNAVEISAEELTLAVADLIGGAV